MGILQAIVGSGNEALVVGNIPDVPFLVAVALHYATKQMKVLMKVKSEL
jgi:hypothetical protein